MSQCGKGYIIMPACLHAQEGELIDST